MSYWDSLREFQRVVAAMDPLREEIRRMEEFRRQLLANPVQEVVDELRRREQMVRDTIAHPLLARDLAAEVVAAREALALASSVLPNPALLAASIRPFLEVSRAVRRIRAG
jgi:hypothetical protein